MDEIKQYKSLDDLKKIISDLEGFMARPVVRGAHPTIYPEVSEAGKAGSGLREGGVKGRRGQVLHLTQNQKGKAGSGLTFDTKSKGYSG